MSQIGVWSDDEFGPEYGLAPEGAAVLDSGMAVPSGWSAAEMAEKYSISVDRAAAFVKIRLGGFFTVDDVRDFAAAQARAYAALASVRGRHITLCDVSDCKIQLQEVVEAFRGLLTDPSLMSERLAFVTGSSPAKMQIRRLIGRESCRFFEDMAAAEQWLRMPAADPSVVPDAYSHAISMPGAEPIANGRAVGQ